MRSNSSASGRVRPRIVGAFARAVAGLFAAAAIGLASTAAVPIAAADVEGRTHHPLTVSCAASVEEVVDTLAARFARLPQGAQVLVNAGGSNLLARQIEAGAEVDLFLSADIETLRRLASRGWIDSASIVVLASNRVVAIVPSDRPLVVREPSDLTAPTVRRVAIADTAVPIGRYTEAFLRRTGLSTALGPRTARTENTRATLAAVAAGAADLGFVYATDARASNKVMIVWEVPPESIPPVRIAAGIVKGRDGPIVRAFVDLLRGPAGRSVFERLGFQEATDAGP